MTLRLASNKPQISSKPTLNNTYVTQCKRCGRGVYERQAWFWSRNPLGIVHLVCEVPS